MIGEAPKAFDIIAPAYDSTRDPLDGSTIERLGELLRADGVHALLEVGVGTGRVAVPLGGRGLTITGIDASQGMLDRARSKGLARLVRGSAYRLPFVDGAFDGALMVHVLHILDEPVLALREATRVGRGGLWALVHPPGVERTRTPDEYEPRRIVYRILAEKGYPLPRRGTGPTAKERTLLRDFPPDRITVVSDRSVTEPLTKRLDMIAAGASRHTLHIPKEILRDAVEAARSRIGDRTFTYRRVEALARWTALTVAGFPGGGTPA